MLRRKYTLDIVRILWYTTVELYKGGVRVYIFTQAAKNLLRHKRRTITAALLLTAMFAVIANQLFLFEHYSAVIEETDSTYNNRWRVSFRDELQYEGNRNNYSGRPYYEDCTGKRTYTFDAEAMAEYNHPYSVTQETFERISDVPYVSDEALAYMVKTYRPSDIIPEGVKALFSKEYKSSVIGCTIVGGSREEFFRTLNEHRGSGMWSYELTEGHYPENGGECTITEYAAYLFGKNIGDTVELYDINGNIRTELTVTGLTTLYYTDCFFDSPSYPHEVKEIDYSGNIRDYYSFHGTPFDRFETSFEDSLRLGETYPDSIKDSDSLFGVMFTTFDTAYNLDREHHINNFTYSCTLEEGYSDEWIGHIRSVLPEEFADEFTAYSFYKTISKINERRTPILENAVETLPRACLLSGAVMLLSILLSVHSSSYDTAVLCALGISSHSVCLTNAVSQAMLAFVCAVLAMPVAIPVFRFSELNLGFLSAENLTFRPSVFYIPFLVLIPVCAFGLAYLSSAVFISVKQPSTLLRSE